MLVIVLIVFSALLFLISLILCLGARQYHKKRLVQIKPERIYSFSKRFLFLLNENIQFQKKHYPIRWITTKSNLKSRQNYPKVIHRITNLAVHDIFHHLNIIFSQIISSLTQPLIISKKCSFCFFFCAVQKWLFFISFRILPDIPENGELFNDQTYIHFYIPSKSENVSIKKFH